MNDFIMPIVEILHDCERDSDRAKWLLEVPIGVIQRDHMTIRAVLRNARFLQGVDYVDALFARNNSTRRDGKYSAAIDETVAGMENFMRHLAREARR